MSASSELKSWHAEHSFFDISAHRIEVEHRAVDHPTEYDGPKQWIVSLTTYCAGVESIIIELDYQTAMALVTEIVDGFTEEEEQ